MEGTINTGTTSKVEETISHNLDAMAMVTAYLNRKEKFKLSRLSRDFRHHIVPRTMVSLSFKSTKCVTESTLFQFCVSTCRKVEKLEFKEVEMDLEYVNRLFEVLSS